MGGLSPFAGFQPGFGLAQLEAQNYSNVRLMPVFSPFAGIHLFAQSLFHFSFSLRYVYGVLFYPQSGSASLSELRLAFGLGMQL